MGEPSLLAHGADVTADVLGVQAGGGLFNALLLELVGGEGVGGHRPATIVPGVWLGYAAAYAAAHLCGGVSERGGLGRTRAL